MDAQPSPSDDMSDLEKRLSAWRPSLAGLDADGVLFAAGRASVRPGWGRIAWPVVSGCLALLVGFLGVALSQERAARVELAARLNESRPSVAPRRPLCQIRLRRRRQTHPPPTATSRHGGRWRATPTCGWPPPIRNRTGRLRRAALSGRSARIPTCLSRDACLSRLSSFYPRSLPMTWLRRWSAPSFLVIVSLTGFVAANDAKPQPEEKWLIDRTLTLSPQPEPRPALEYRLFPLASDRKDGNAVPIYLRLNFEQNDAARRDWSETPQKWNEAPIDEFRSKKPRSSSIAIRGSSGNLS